MSLSKIDDLRDRAHAAWDGNDLDDLYKVAQEMWDLVSGASLELRQALKLSRCNCNNPRSEEI